MTTKYTKTNVVTGDTVKSDVNVQLGEIEASISDTLSRSGGSGNTMEADIDLNSNDIINVQSIRAQQIYLNGELVTDITSTAPISGTTDLTAGYAWTGQHSFTLTPTVGGNDSLDKGNINEAVVNVNAQTGTSYTTILGDRAGLVTMSNAASNTITIPPASGVAYPTGTVLSFSQIGAGQTTIAAGVGVTLNHVSGLVMTGQYSMASAILISADTWLVSGSLTV